MLQKSNITDIEDSKSDHSEFQTLSSDEEEEEHDSEFEISCNESDKEDLNASGELTSVTYATYLSK